MLICEECLTVRRPQPVCITPPVDPTATGSGLQQPVGLPDDAALVRLAEGDRDALAQIYAHHGEEAYALAQLIYPAHAAGVVDGACLALWRQARAGQCEGPVGARLLRITRQHALALLHDGHHHALHPSPHTARAPTSLIELDERQARAALAGLPGVERHCIEMAYFDALSVAQIAALTHLPPAAVSDHLQRGISAVRRHLTAHVSVEHATEHGRD